ncbi:30S ribosomal protein S14 [Candidatus Woesearchaeota archaeon]|nr:30S ribosomal protein S14 [Candidatus Woesearchaeota archaeon]
MTYSDHKKVFKQLRAKPVKLKKFVKHNAPKERKFGRSSRKCRRCGRIRGHIKKYGLNLCRQCFREIATKLGFKKYS